MSTLDAELSFDESGLFWAFSSFVFMMSVIELSVILLSVVAPKMWTKI